MVTAETLRQWSHHVAEYLHAFPNDHPAQIALRTYALALSLSLGPSVAGFLSNPRRHGLHPVLRALQRDGGVTGFAFAMTVAVAGGASLRSLWDALEKRLRAKLPPKMSERLARLKDVHKTLLANVLSASLAIALMHRRHSRPKLPKLGSPLPLRNDAGNALPPNRPSPTLDLTLLFLVRAMDAIVRAFVLPSPIASSTQSVGEDVNKKRRSLAARLDALAFWASSARIMWCFFYEPHRLPRSYNKWIMTLANIDPRILGALRAIREGRWSYTRGLSTPPDLVSSLSRDLGYPEAWGDPARIPSLGGPTADLAWKRLGVSNRPGLGGIPCELVHGGTGGGSCVSNAFIRGVKAFAEAMLIYVPVHFAPILLTKPRKLLRADNVMQTLLSALRSSSFLSSFVSSIWITVCLTRTLLLARLMPWIPHDFWDGPHGCAFLGSLVCGSTIWIEQGRRRGEMALYVLPRAIRACLPESYLRGGRHVKLLERLVFVASLATLLTASSQKPDCLRGLSKWTVAFVMNGPNAGFWKKKRHEVSEPSTPKTIPSRP